MTERIKNSQEGQQETVFNRQWQEAAQKFISYQTAQENSQLAYGADITQLTNFLSEHAVYSWSQITPAIIRDFFEDQGDRDSSSTLVRRLSVINGFISYIRKRTDYPIKEDVFPAIRSFRKESSNLPRRNFDYEPMSREDVTKLLQVTTHVRDKVLIYLLLKGISAQSLENLEMQNVKASANVQDPTIQISVPDKKIGKTTKVTALTRQGIWFIINKYAGKAQIDCTPHRLNKSEKALHESSN